MKTILRTLAICIALAIAAPLHAANPIILTPPGQGATALVPVLVDSDGVIQRPTNFFAANFSQVSSQLATNHPTFEQTTNAMLGIIDQELGNAVLVEETNGVLRLNSDLKLLIPGGTMTTNTLTSTRWLLGTAATGTGITNNQDPTSVFNGLWGLHPDYAASTNAVTCYFTVPVNADVANSNVWLYVDLLRGNAAGNSCVLEYDLDGADQVGFSTFFPTSAQRITNALPTGPISRVIRFQIPLDPYFANTNCLAPGELRALKLSRVGDHSSDNNTGFVYPVSLTLEYLAK